ncbi:uncharacterized protein [Ptychodera flava]|uniref:uncharacterized protein n=1 Tax=Ptychodera flava TaxID=63121 RepID=UPI00396A4C1B
MAFQKGSIWVRLSSCLLFKRDLSRAYRQIPVDPNDYRYLGYTWRGLLFLDLALPFGLRTAALACQRTTNAINYIYNQRGYECVNYIDDFGGAETQERADDAFLALGNLLSELGVNESVEKAVPPTTSLVFLGILINTLTMSLEVTPDRLHDIEVELGQWGNKRRATRKEIQSLIGKLSFAAKCVKPGRALLNRMLDLLRSLKRSSHHAYLNREFHADVLWWARFMRVYNGVTMINQAHWSRPDDIFSSDACLTGCGGCTSAHYFHAEFPSSILNLDLHINALELLAVTVATKLWGNEWGGKRIQVYCDNEATVTVINTGRTRDRFMACCLRELYFIAATCCFEIRAVHLAGSCNRVADGFIRCTWAQNIVKSANQQ